MVILYNLISFIIDAMALFSLRRVKNPVNWVLTLIAAGAIELLMGKFFCRDGFAFIRLGAYVVFLHGFVLLIGSAAVFWREKRLLAVFAGIGSIVLPVLAYYMFLIEPFWLDVSYRKIASPKIGRPIRIAVLADLQTDTLGDYQRRVFRRIIEEKPDLILLAGDYIQSPYEQYADLSREINAFLREINFAAPLGIFAVQGNVDPADWRKIFKNLDVTTVAATNTFDLGDLRLTCLGLGESFYTAAKVTNPDPAKFHVVLGHAPNFALGDIEGDLLIAGHTHGGQVRLPFIGPIVTLCEVPRSWAAGFTVLPGGTKLLVSRGIGMERGYAPRIRFLCRPELAIIDLIPQDNNH